MAIPIPRANRMRIVITALSPSTERQAAPSPARCRVGRRERPAGAPSCRWRH
jgi:hypothetical protein